ncbi:SMa0974 family conjugal transfer regulator [Sinorhizobium fredii]|uniref:SMa0974 family conjugal transfer regulator n=1 Tax=Rhizobium fredii TaxID=380 RepID=UPI0004B16F65|nr:hypothetical protein [Sinorhizobium fredii]AWM28174.1 hypothetical protein AOX55_00005397 [Sinorhizobium fredii CCBAU 25509]MQW95715.1 hypothetical protein [Sinorhizobium fredii]
MHQHVFTCYIFLSNPQCFVEQMRLRLAGFYEYTIEQGSEKTFIFTDGYAAARAVDGGLRMRIGAANLVSSHAIRIAFEVSIFQILQSPPEKIAWYPAASAPPTTIGEAPRSEVV